MIMPLICIAPAPRSEDRSLAESEIKKAFIDSPLAVAVELLMGPCFSFHSRHAGTASPRLVPKSKLQATPAALAPGPAIATPCARWLRRFVMHPATNRKGGSCFQRIRIPAAKEAQRF
jgi:hypothetical protein